MKNKSYSTLIYLVFSILLAAYSCSPKTGKDLQTQPDATTSEGETWRSEVPQPGPAPAFNLGDYEEFSLDNGLKVIVVENHKLPVISYQLFVDKGPVKEGDITGVSSIAGQMLATGTTSRTKAEIDDELDFIAASLNTNSNGFFASTLKKHSDVLLELAADVLFNPSFPESEFDRIIQNTKSGLTFQKSDPSSIASNVGNAILYGKDHPYGEFTTEKTIEAITLDDVRDYYKKYYLPDVSYLIVVGDITKEEARQQAEQYFGKWEKQPSFRPLVPDNVEAPAERTVSFTNKDGAVQSVITVTQPVDFKPDTEDRIAASVMNTVLGGYFGSRLNKNIREDKGYTYGIRSGLSPDRYIGDFSISASVRNEVTDSTLTEILYELEKIRSEEVGEKELTLVKNVLTGQFARGLEQPRTIAQYALNIARYNLPKDYYKTYLERLNAVTPEQIRAAANKYIRPDQMHFFIVGNEAEVASSLAGFDQDGTIDFYDEYANKIEKSQEEDAGDVSAEDVINHYLKAIGGRDAVENVKSFSMTSKASTPMGDVTTSITGKNNEKVRMKVEASGMVVQEIVFNGTKAKIGGVQGSQTIDDPEEFDRYRSMAAFADELDYFSSDAYEVSYGGKESVDGEPAYKIQVKSTDGTRKTEYYSVESGLKLKEVINVEANGQQISTTQVFSDYEAQEGILIPMKVTMSGGGMPFEMVTEVEKVEINPEIADSEFAIE